MAEEHYSVPLTSEQCDWLISLIRDQLSWSKDTDDEDEYVQITSIGEPILASLLATKGLRTYTVEAQADRVITVDAPDETAAREQAQRRVRDMAGAVQWHVTAVTDRTQKWR